MTFVKGHIAHNHKPDGTVADSTQADGCVKRRIKLCGKWILYSHYVWERVTGEKVAKSEIIRFADGNRLNFDISNLKKMDRRDHVRVNRKQEYWTPEDADLLARIYPDTQMSEMMRIFKRSRKQIQQKAYSSGLEKNPDCISDLAIAETLAHGKGCVRDAILENAELIRFKRAQILLNRKIKQHGNKN